MSTFYTGVDKQRYDAGEKFLPMNKFLASYTEPKTKIEEGVTTSYGIPNTNAFTGGGGNNYYPGSTSSLVSSFNKDIQAYNERIKEGNRPLREAQFPAFPDISNDQQAYNLATQALAKGADPNAQGFASYTGGTLEGLRDIAAERIQDHHEKARTGQFGPSYIEGEKPTWSRKINDFAYDYIPGINRPQSYEDIMTHGYQEPQGLGLPSIIGFMNKVGIQNFSNLSQADQAFITSQKGYKGPTVFGENTTGLNVDPFGKNVESLFGNYAEGVRKDFDKLSGHLTQSAKNRGLTFDPVKGALVDAQGNVIDEKDYDDAMDDFAYMNKLNLTRFGFRKNQINKQKDISSDLSLIDQARAYDIQQTQDRIDRDETNINKATERGQAINKNEGIGTVNPTSDYGKKQGYTGGHANPHTQSGWSGSKKEKMATGGRVGYKRGRVVNPGGYAGDEEGGIVEWLKSKMGIESETNPTMFGTQDSLLNRGSINQLKNTIKSYEAMMHMGELDEEQLADYELKLAQLQALEEGAQSKADGGRVGFKYGGLASIL